MSEAKLKLAPLKEVIFELQWAGGVDTNGNPIDDGFDLAQGKLAEKLKIEYPVHKKLIPDGIPFRIFGVPLHQYWKDEFKCPVIQHGSGILAVNDVEINYEWEQTYKPIVISAINSLINSYDEPIKFNKAKLQYIDAWDYHEQDPKDFVKDNLIRLLSANLTLQNL